MKVGIDQVMAPMYVIGTPESELQVEIPDSLVKDLEESFGPFLAAQVRLGDWLEKEFTKGQSELQWCPECADLTTPDPSAGCSVCGFPYPEQRESAGDLA